MGSGVGNEMATIHIRDAIGNLVCKNPMKVNVLQFRSSIEYNSFSLIISHSSCVNDREF